jgi:hypothetical protein
MACDWRGRTGEDKVGNTVFVYPLDEGERSLLEWETDVCVDK